MSKEDLLNFKLSDRDFAKILAEQNNPFTILNWGINYLSRNNTKTEEAPETTTVLIKTIINLETKKPTKLNYKTITPDECATHLNSISDEQKLADGIQWIKQNNKPISEIIPVATILILTVKKMLRL